MLAYLAAALVLVFPALVIVGALRDATSYTIPNWISLALVGTFPLAALAMGLPLPAIGLHLGIGFAALVAGMAMFALRWIGGGDAKLFAAAALWLGLPASINFLLVTCIAGGALAVMLLWLRSAWFRPITAGAPGLGRAPGRARRERALRRGDLRRRARRLPGLSADGGAGGPRLRLRGPVGCA
ncbi:prepilin peptidase [Phenylobacterium sp. J367]|uniref:A24 family peptidase n=1 Tax=Phenylobacterium sp. J367 TaxID=2898435 RepID=UPI0027E32B05|nr:prepilin peptidase [Phenylobacterium sp. J367]